MRRWNLFCQLEYKKISQSVKFPQAIATELRTAYNTITVVMCLNYNNYDLYICADKGIIITFNTVSNVVLQFLTVTTEGQYTPM